MFYSMMTGMNMFYSTVTDLAKFLGQSTLQPRITAMWYDNNCIGITVSKPLKQITIRDNSQFINIINEEIC